MINEGSTNVKQIRANQPYGHFELISPYIKVETTNQTDRAIRCGIHAFLKGWRSSSLRDTLTIINEELQEHPIQKLLSKYAVNK